MISRKKESLALLKGKAKTRLMAIEMLLNVRSFEQVSESIGIHPDTLRRWYKRYRSGDPAFYEDKKRGPKQPTRSLNDDQAKSLRELICHHYPDELGCDDLLWTREAIAEIIEKCWHRRISEKRLTALLGRMELLPKLPDLSPMVKDKLQAIAKKEGALIMRLVVYTPGADQDDVWCAPAERHNKVDLNDGSEVMSTHGTPNLIAAVTLRGKRYFMASMDAIKPEMMVSFLRRIDESVPKFICLLARAPCQKPAPSIIDWYQEERVGIRLCYDHTNSNVTRYALNGQFVSKDSPPKSFAIEDILRGDTA